MRMLIAIGAYFPALNFGGPVISIDNICRQLQGDIDFYIVTLDHDLKSSKRLRRIKEGWNDIGYANVLYLSDKEVNYKNLYAIIESINPDIIYTNNFFWGQFTVPFFRIAKKTGRRLIVAPRGEFFENAMNKKYKKLPYTYLMRKLYMGDNIFFHATSQSESIQFKKYMKISDSSMFILPNMATLVDVDEPDNISDRKVLKVVYLARIHESKNLLYALDILSEISFPVVFDIYGNIENRLYWEACENKIKSLNDNIKVNYQGIAERSQIQSIFASHHVFLFPTITENFGHSISESLLSGCPAIISDNTPWNWVNKEKFSYALPLCDKQAYIHVLTDIYEMPDDSYLSMRKTCKTKTREHLNARELAEQYKAVFLKIAEKG